LKIRYTAEAHRDLVDALDHGMRTDPAATAHLADRLLFVIERLGAGEFEGPERC
jgi:plasmid stabilization system protein ParE